MANKTDKTTANTGTNKYNPIGKFGFRENFLIISFHIAFSRSLSFHKIKKQRKK